MLRASARKALDFHSGVEQILVISSIASRPSHCSPNLSQISLLVCNKSII